METSPDLFAALVARAGLDPLPPAELAGLKRLYDSLAPQLALLRAAVDLTDEPATTFQADLPSTQADLPSTQADLPSTQADPPSTGPAEPRRAGPPMPATSLPADPPSTHS